MQEQNSAVDANGNVFIVGHFRGTVTIGGFVLANAGDNIDGFVAKWSPTDQRFLWVQQLGSTGDEDVAAVAVSGNSVYITGSFSSLSLQVGATTLTNVQNVGYSSSDVFVAKLIDAGTSSSFVWAQRAGGIGDETVRVLTVQGTSVYLGGAFKGGPTVFGDTPPLYWDFGFDMFVAKLTDNGSSSSFRWARRAGGIKDEYVLGLAVQGTDVYFSGNYASPTAGFGSITLSNSSPTAVFSTDGFVAKLRDAGSTASFGWALKVGGAEHDYCRALAIQGSDVYVSGGFNSPTISLGNTVLTNVNRAGTSADGFILKLADTGAAATVSWAQSVGGVGTEEVIGLALNGKDLYVAGTFATSPAAPTASFGPYTLTGAGDVDIFAAKLTDDGPASSVAWVQQAGGASYDGVTSLSLASTGIHLIGRVRAPNVRFGTLVINGSSTSNTSYVATLAEPIRLAAHAATQLPGLAMFPNPAAHQVTISLPALSGTTTVGLTLTDAVGRVVRTATCPLPATGLRYALPLTGLAPGPYIVRLQAGDQQTAQVLAVE
ncbi:T9SS type A sorting domain-containing protein [Hymenobacter cellulosivorans]|uniref:T9SS type A sorting domain-containing protein n=1 Tax=Hymenobacter cellulosivorans TaxID=2932249 RepID=A0ABY4FG91_9BACT|nr:T9SS type A sorting domain-containing protein [Hymenobacter cellulosivorans]UOQ55654.1 T9SS type A sorting domain-containing protein [Hymenobacter cellulosivorans]